MPTHRLWVVIPAAGSGRRMFAEFPKQYMPLLERTVLEWSVGAFLDRDDIAGIVIVLAAGDEQFASLPLLDENRVSTAMGGVERSDSVLSGLRALSKNRRDAAGVKDDDWVLVHDAARPCLHPDDLQRLITTLQSDAVGGLLAAPVADTLKAGDAEQRVTATPPRDGLWRALTPQMFRYGVLIRALEGQSAGAVTDESAAVESLGLRPRLVPGRTDNIKVTLPEDLEQAEFILRRRFCDQRVDAIEQLNRASAEK